MKVLTVIWNWLNGNKTLLGTLLLVLVAEEGCFMGNCMVESVLQWIGTTLAGAGVLHKLAKGVNNT